MTSDNTSVEVSQPTIATASSAVESTTEPSPLVEEVVQPKSLITPRSVQNHTSANMEVVKTTEDTPKDLKAKILNNKDSLIWFDYNKAKFIGNNNETVPVIGTKVVNDKYNFKHTILKEGMTFEQEIKNHPFLEGARIKLEVSRLLPFTGAEEFKNRLEKYNKDNPNKKFDLSSTDMDQLSKNTYLWDHNKDKRIEKGKEAEIVLRDADRKWSNLFNALNNGEKVVNDNYNSDSLKKSINLPNSVLGSINEAANIGAEFKITLVTKDGKEEAVTLIAADAEEANYSEAIIFKTEGDNWKKLADIGFKGNISDKRWSAKPGEKEVSKKTPENSLDEDVHRHTEPVIEENKQNGLEEFIELNYKYFKKNLSNNNEKINFDKAKEMARNQTKFPKEWSNPDHIKKLVEFAKELAKSDSKHWRVNDKGTVTRTYYDTFKTRFEDDENKILRPALVRTPAAAWVSPSENGGLGTKWFGPVLTAQDYRTVPIIYSENTKEFGIYIAST